MNKESVRTNEWVLLLVYIALYAPKMTDKNKISKNDMRKDK